MSETATPLSHETAWNMAATLRVLVIEHTLADAELSLHVLQRAGFHCQPDIVDTREKFLDYFRRFTYNVVLADFRLPGWTGMDAAVWIRKSGSDIPFILVTGTLGEEVAVECIRQGVTDYVLKGHLSRLPLVVSRALEEKTLRDARNFMVDTLRQSEANSLFLFAHNPLPMWVLERRNLQILQVNDAALRHYGYEQVEFLNMTADNLHPPEEVPSVIDVFQGPCGNEKISGQWHHRLKNGKLIDVEILLHTMEYSGHRAALVVAQDVTERKRAEEEKQKFFTLVENSRDFIAVANLRGHIEYVNPAGRALIGFTGPESVKGARWRRVVAVQDLALIRNTIRPALRSSGYWHGELRFRHRQTGQLLPMDFVGFGVKDQETSSVRFVATVSRDMTERRTLEKQLWNAQKFEAVGQLAGGVAHDFNNVIGAILGWAELGEEQAGTGETQLASYFNKIHLQCDRVTLLVRQLLAFARGQILEPRDISLNQSVRDVLNLLDKVIGKDVEMRTTLAEDLALVRADPTQIEQVLMNLCINARDAMPTGGRLSIETANAELSAMDCHLIAESQPGHFVKMSVTDTGSGMTAAVRERIFEPFFTTKEDGKGTGLGLATVYGIVKQHSGFVEVQSKPGEGTTFHIFLPRSEVVVPTEKAHPIAGEQPIRGGTETILLAEDHEGVREMARAALESLGYRVLLARDGEEAVSIFSVQHSSIAMVVLDVIMPRRGGPEVHATIAALSPDIPVMFVTGYSKETAVLTEMMDRGIVVLQKPYSPWALCRLVRKTLDRVAIHSSPHV